MLLMLKLDFMIDYFQLKNPEGEEGKDFKEFLNPKSLEILSNCKLEPSLKIASTRRKISV